MIANCLSMVVRIGYCIWFMRTFFGKPSSRGVHVYSAALSIGPTLVGYSYLRISLLFVS